MNIAEQTAILQPFVSANKKALIEKVLKNRTRYFKVVLEDVWKAQNASAVMRTCECMGVQDLFLVEKKYDVKTYSNVGLGAEKWLSCVYYRENNGENVEECLFSLKRDGYRICATTLSDTSISLPDYEIAGKTAFIFGTEQTGISKQVREAADDLVKIPMAGFTDSYNLSASVAITLQHSFARIRENMPSDFYLSIDEKNKLRLDWYKKIVKGSDLIVERQK